MAELTRVNGKAFDHSSVVFTIAGRKLRQVKEIKYSQKRNRSKVPGLTKSQVAVARTRGNYEPDKLTVTTTRHEAQAVRDLLASKAPDGESYGDPEVPIVCQYVERGLPPCIDAFTKCCLESDGGGTSYGADALYEDLVFDFFSLKRNGKHLYSNNT